MRVGSISTCSNPADTSLSRYSLSSSAPATQPTHRSMFCRICAPISPRVTTSETASRPPGFSTRNASRNTRSLSAERLITQFEMMTSTELSGSGICSISPFKNSTLSAPALRLLSFASASISSVMSRPYALPVGPTRLAESKTSIPPPEPRSSTVSPGLSFARAVGLPHPSEASIASSGICWACDSSQRFDVIGSQESPSAGAAPQQLLPPLLTRKAACPYFSFTTSLMLISAISRLASGMVALLFTELDEVLRLKRLVAGAALGIKKLQNFAQRFSVGGVVQKRALALDLNELFILELVEMVRKRGAGDLELVLNFADHQPLRMRGKQQLHDPQARFGAHGRKHVGVAGNAPAVR